MEFTPALRLVATVAQSSLDTVLAQIPHLGRTGEIALGLGLTGAFLLGHSIHRHYALRNPDEPMF